MKAIVINQFGTPEVLKIQTDIPTPSISSDQVLIKIYAAVINPLDWKIRQGDLKFILGSAFPMVLGNDASGVIIEVGSAVRNFKIGDEVYCLLDTSAKTSLTGFAKSGAYAQMAVTREDTLSLKPKVMTH
jgi:NADPH2:quinone reductase